MTQRTLGILGGGQLGRMTVIAAARLGIDCVVLTPEPDSPASHVARHTFVASWNDAEAAAEFAAAADVITLEFENVDVALVDRLAAQKPVRPGARALEVSQDRLVEKGFVRDLGIATAGFVDVDNEAALHAALGELGAPAILKTRRLGYDGKGQVRIDSRDDAGAAMTALGGAPAILEAFVPFRCEVSAIVARSADGACRSWDVVENQHENHILRRTIAPAPVEPALAREAAETAAAIAAGLDLVGLLAVEFFVTAEGGLLVNEIAPRPHNSGHWTLDACGVSQFEQLVRAVMGLPLGDPSRHSDAVMTNLLGDEASPAEVAPLLAEPGACVHLYGKAAARPGRKMGHVTRLRPASS